MHRIAFRSFHAHLNTYRQAWPTPATRSTWHSQRQPFESCRRQFHVSSPKRSALQTPAGFFETAIQETILFDAIQSIPEAYFCLAVGLVFPHYLRYRLETRAKKKLSDRYNIGAPLDIVHTAVVIRRSKTRASNSTSTGTSSEQVESVLSVNKLSRDFANRINDKYAEPYSTWERRTLIPPALHVVWTTLMVMELVPKSLVVSHTLSQLSTGDPVGHVIACGVLVYLFFLHIRSNRFWLSFPSAYVEQMRPWLRSLYGLKTTVTGRSRNDVMPYWMHQWREMAEPRKLEALPKHLKQFKYHLQDVNPSVIILGLAATIVWNLTFLQVSYLIAAFVAARVRDFAYKGFESQLNRKVYKSRRKWVPMTPYY